MFTAKFFSETARCHPFLGNDIVYLPTLEGSWETPYHLEGDCSWIREVIPDIPPGVELRGACVVDLLKMKFEAHLDQYGKEPDWIHRLNLEQQKNFRRFYAITDAELFFCLPNVPRAGLGYFVTDEGITADITRAFDLERLRGIRQLGRLHDPIITDAGFHESYGMLFDHNRLSHSLDVRAIALLMATNNGLTPEETRILEVAGLTHDTLTPAYGDGTKAIDPQYFDEDANYRRLFLRPQWGRVRDMYQIDETLLAATVQGDGVLGSLLDMADKLAYLSRDVDAYVCKYNPDGPLAYPEDYHPIQQLVEKRPSLFGLWGAVRTIDGQMVVDDGEWLGDVLALRALMFRNLYHHPGARCLERMTGIILIKNLIKRGVLSKHSLLILDDTELDRLIERYYGVDITPLIIGSFSLEPRVEIFPTISAAKQREREVINSGVPITFIDAHPSAKAGTHFLVRSGGSIMPFADAYPQETQKIEEILATTTTVKLYYLAVRYNDLPTPLKEVADGLSE